MLQAAKRSVVIAAALTVCVIGAFTAPAQAEPLSAEKLAEQGWECFLTPPFVTPPRIVCANKGLGRPFPGNLDPPPAYNLPTFDLAGSFLGHVHLIRADLYRGEPCAQAGEPYVFRAAIGYYECLRT
jgi:hypothetical protein